MRALRELADDVWYDIRTAVNNTEPVANPTDLLLEFCVAKLHAWIQ
jgi:hypothetical protein